jgi:quinol monooxygenase YgiN
MVVFVNKLTLAGSSSDLERLYERIGDFMSEQPGLLRYQLVRSRKDEGVYFNIAEWTDPEAFETALQQERFRELYAELKPLIRGDAHLSDVVQEGRSALV